MKTNLTNMITWSLLQKVQKIGFVKSMYIWIFLVPIAAKTLAKVVDESAVVSVFGYSFHVQLSLPFSWPLFYFSAMCFALGNAFFHMYCPRLIADHENFAEFDGKGKSVLQLYEYTSDIKLDWSAIRTEVGIDDVTPVENNQKVFQDLLWCAFKKANLYLPSARLATALFYLVASHLILVIILQNTEVVANSVLSK